MSTREGSEPLRVLIVNATETVTVTDTEPPAAANSYPAGESVATAPGWTTVCVQG